MRKFIMFGAVIGLLALVAFCLQSQLFLCGDVAFLLHVTDLMQGGGTYAQNFFETNPPMILMLYSPVVLFSKWTSIDVIPVVRVYVLLLALMSLACCYQLLTQILAQKNKRTLFFMMSLLTFTFFFLPAGDFGQREHLLSILFFPYVFLAVLRAEKKSVAPLFALGVGIAAALGIGMKPFFLVPLLLIESYLIFVKRSVFSSFRIESIACALTLIFYLLGVYLMAPTYVHIILPLVSHLYFISSAESWGVIFARASVIFCLLTAAYFVIFQQRFKQHLARILWLALIGMIAAFLIPRSAWYYHLIPAMGLALLLMGVCLTQAKANRRIFWLLGFVVMLMPVYESYEYTLASLQAKQQSDRTQIVAYVHSNTAIHSVYCFSASYTQDCFPLVDMTHKIYGGRSPFFWWLAGLVSLENKSAGLSPQIIQDKNYLVTAIADDLTQNKTDLVILNVADMKNKLGGNFDAINYFSTNKKFRAAWKSYRYVTAIGDYQLFERKA